MNTSENIVSRLMKQHRKLEFSILKEGRLNEADDDDSTAPTQGDPDDHTDDEGYETMDAEVDDSEEESTSDDEPEATMDTAPMPKIPNAHVSRGPDIPDPSTQAEFPTTTLEPGEYENPLKNPYATHFTMGDNVTLTYTDGTNANLKGVVDGFDPEGFYKIKWDDGKITNGITDIALADLIEKQVLPVKEGKCICGSTHFLKEGKYIICDNCGRQLQGLTESVFFVRYTYAGDGLSPYESTLVVDANSIEEAIEKARNAKPEGYNFREDTDHPVVASIQDYQKKYPDSNLEVLSETLEDELTVIEKPKRKPLKIRGEVHDMTTAVKPSISE